MRTPLMLGTALALAAPAMLLARPQAGAPVAATAAPFTHEEVMIPMRDGKRMQTIVWRPTWTKEALPILLVRTPYGIPDAAPATMPDRYADLEKDGYIIVQQNMRGRFKSEGTFTLSTAVHPNDPGAVDEATDAYDTIDWLVKNVKPNNGKVGMYGVSYPGFAAAVALARPHPALKAVSPQASWIDYWQSDDLHRNGALRLSYATDWLYQLQHEKDGNPLFPYPSFDTYDFFLNAGSAADIEAKWMKGSVPAFSALIEHPDHDAYFTSQRWSDSLGRTRVPTLNVAGFWDQEDPWGSWRIYERQEQDDPDHLNLMVAGPWNHGGWQGTGDTMGRIPIGHASGTDFKRDIQAPFFAWWLHGKGTKPAYEARMFQSGSYVWKDYASWPPRQAKPTDLYLHADGTLSFTAPAAGEACRSYVSDPASPVPFRQRPMSATYATPDWRTWEFDDQRFVDHRPDVLGWTSAPLTQDLTVTGSFAATLMAATSGTDGDFVVKLIDVYPDDAEKAPGEAAKVGDYAKSLDGYQLPVAMEVRRGRYLASDTTPAPLTPGKVTPWTFPLRDHDHVFKAGHRIMVQVQSSWFPMIDRNPQSFVPNIYRAKAADYVTATQQVCAGSKVVLPVMG